MPAIHAGHNWFQYRLTLGTSRTAVTSIVRQVRLAANSSRGTVRARVNAGVEAGQLQVLFEDRRLTAKAGVWGDEFAPYAVHVYAW